jgi:hypothetical protein
LEIQRDGSAFVSYKNEKLPVLVFFIGDEYAVALVILFINLSNGHEAISELCGFI